MKKLKEYQVNLALITVMVIALIYGLMSRDCTYKDFILQGQEAVQTFLNAQAIPDPNGCGRPLVLTVDGVIGRDTSAAWSLYRANEYYGDN